MLISLGFFTRPPGHRASIHEKRRALQAKARRGARKSVDNCETCEVTARRLLSPPPRRRPHKGEGNTSNLRLALWDGDCAVALAFVLIGGASRRMQFSDIFIDQFENNSSTVAALHTISMTFRTEKCLQS